jgi:hypothetical protein
MTGAGLLETLDDLVDALPWLAEARDYYCTECGWHASKADWNRNVIAAFAAHDCARFPRWSAG